MNRPGDTYATSGRSPEVA